MTGGARLEHLYLLTSRARPELGLMVTVKMPGDPPSAAALEEVQRFLGLLGKFYETLGGSGLVVEKLREARFDLPSLPLESGPGDSIPVDKFVETFARWVQVEREARD